MPATTVRQVLPLPSMPEVEVPSIVQGYCNVCGSCTAFRVSSSNLREDASCCMCGSFSRQRQLAAALLAVVGGDAAGHVGALPTGMSVWNMEASRALHVALSQRLGSSYTATEFVAEGLASGTRSRGTMHVDVRVTHFAPATFDVVLSSDVLEHVPGHRLALAEIHRVLRPGGWHVFTVPFSERLWRNEIRAIVGSDGTIEHLLPATFHGDPLRREGVLVYQVFGLELLHELAAAGFEPRLLDVHDPRLGILDHGAVFAAQKALR